jgi:outer membrane protein OmpA-like peptidoglycan-associated protein/osmotically-inducible protein OsmY
MNWQRWIRPGLVLTFLVALVAVLLRHGAVESDVSARVREALATDGQSWATVSASARDVAIGGTAPAPEAQRRAVAVAAAVDGVRAVSDASGLLPIISPFVWSARRQGNGIALTGSVPSEGSRAAILAAARRAVPDAEIADGMTLARGAAPSFNAAVTFALARLASLSDGVVSVTDGVLTVSGTARSAAAFADVRQAIAAAPPAGVAIGAADILPARADPFVLSASFDGKTLSLIGYIPSEPVHDALIATARATLPGVAISDSLALASGEPPHFAEAASFAIAALSHLTQGGVTLDGLNVDVTGRAKSIEDYEALIASTSGALPAGLTIVARSVEPAPAANYGWQAERDGDQISLSGYVPSAEDRDTVSETAQALFPGLTVDNRVRVASGEPRMDWIGAIKFAMGELAQLARGKVSVGDKTLSVEGEAASADAYATLVDANAKTLPASLSLDKANIAPPRASPYIFRAERAADGGIVIAGNAGNPADRTAILALAHRRFGAAEIGGDLAYASGEPAGFVDAVGIALAVLSRMSGGSVEIRDAALSVNGLTYEPAAVDGIADTLANDLPSGFSVAADTVAARQADQPVTAAECRDLIDDVVQTGGIAFDGTTADISADSIGVLDRVAAAMARCDDAHVEVGAYSDNQGSAARNRDRTQARAEAIVEFLVAAGVKRERLTATGYGEDKPIADNDTEAGRAKNQRVEFAVALSGGG